MVLNFPYKNGSPFNYTECETLSKTQLEHESRLSYLNKVMINAYNNRQPTLLHSGYFKLLFLTEMATNHLA